MEGLLLGWIFGASPPVFGRSHSLSRTVPPYTKKWICIDLDAVYFDNFQVISREEFGLSPLTLFFSTSSLHDSRQQPQNRNWF